LLLEALSWEGIASRTVARLVTPCEGAFEADRRSTRNFTENSNFSPFAARALIEGRS
jgi:hypothetical protein